MSTKVCGNQPNEAVSEPVARQDASGAPEAPDSSSSSQPMQPDADTSASTSTGFLIRDAMSKLAEEGKDIVSSSPMHAPPVLSADEYTHFTYVTSLHFT